jgi:hypothetical protein
LAAYKAKGTAVNCWLLSSTKALQAPDLSKDISKNLACEFHTICEKELAMPPVRLPVPIITLTIPKASVRVVITSSYSVIPEVFLNTNFKHKSLSPNGAARLSTPGKTWLSRITAW